MEGLHQQIRARKGTILPSLLGGCMNINQRGHDYLLTLPEPARGGREGLKSTTTVATTTYCVLPYYLRYLTTTALPEVAEVAEVAAHRTMTESGLGSQRWHVSAGMNRDTRIQNWVGRALVPWIISGTNAHQSIIPRLSCLPAPQKAEQLIHPYSTSTYPHAAGRVDGDGDANAIRVAGLTHG